MGALVEDYEGCLERLGVCFNDKELSDVLLETEDGRHFYCHKIVLAAASPVFAAMFRSHGCKETLEGRVAVKELDPDAVEWLLVAIYTGKGVLIDKTVVQVMMAAKMYQVDWVLNECRFFLSSKISMDNCCPIFDQIVGVANLGLQGLFARFIHDNVKDLWGTEKFLNLSVDALRQLAVYPTTLYFCISLLEWFAYDLKSRVGYAGCLWSELDFFSLKWDELQYFSNKIKKKPGLDSLQHELESVIRARLKHGKKC